MPNASEVQLKHYGLDPKKYYGQNFLTDSSIPEKMASVVKTDPPGVIMEVGPGLGILTKELAKVGSKVIAYEIDKDLEPALKDNLRNYPNVEIIFEDFLKTDLSIYSGQDLSFVSNLPYYITTPVLFKALKANVNFVSYTVMMQKEVAQRFLAKCDSPDYNALSVIAWYLCDIKKIMKVSKQCFNPQPKVDSMIIQMRRRPYPIQVSNQEEFFTFVRGMFQLRRKTCLNNLTKITDDKDKAARILNKAEIEIQTRPQQLSIEQLIKIYEVSKDA